jgi:quercetin dioxygenase-like cupin family protein
VSYLVDLDAVAPIDVWGEAVRARTVSGDRLTLALVELAPDAIVPEHRHENEQMGMVVSGTVTMTVDGERRLLEPGGTWRIPSNRPHDLITGPDGALVIDVFTPIREDWDALPRVEPRPIPWPGR